MLQSTLSNWPNTNFLWKHRSFVSKKIFGLWVLSCFLSISQRISLYWDMLVFLFSFLLSFTNPTKISKIEIILSSAQCFINFLLWFFAQEFGYCILTKIYIPLLTMPFSFMRCEQIFMGCHTWSLVSKNDWIMFWFIHKFKICSKNKRFFIPSIICTLHLKKESQIPLF